MFVTLNHHYPLSLFKDYLEMSKIWGYKKGALCSIWLTHSLSMFPFIWMFSILWQKLPNTGNHRNKKRHFMSNFSTWLYSACTFFGLLIIRLKLCPPVFFSPAITWNLQCIVSFEFTGYC